MKIMMREPHPRTLLKMVIAVMIIDIIVPVFASISFANSINAQNKARDAAILGRQNQIAQYQTCLANNEYRMDNIILWRKVVSLVDGSTPAGKRFDSEVLAVVYQVDAPRHCVPPPSG